MPKILLGVCQGDNSNKRRTQTFPTERLGATAYRKFSNGYSALPLAKRYFVKVHSYSV